jgi:5'-nucleotidase
MLKFRTMIAAAAMTVAIPAFAAGPQAARAPEPFMIKLIALNDFHGYISPPSGTVRAPSTTDPSATVNLSVGGAAYAQTLVEQLRAENPLHAVVAAGDLIGASPLNSALFHDEPTIESLNLMGLDFASVGNHEFDKGQDELKRMQRGGCYPEGTVGVDTCIIDGAFPGASFQYLAANVIQDTNGASLFPPYRIKSFTRGRGPHADEVRVAFIGLTLEGTPSIVTPTGVAGLTFKDEAETVNKLVPVLKAQGVRAIVVLVHQGGTTTGLYDDQSCPGLSGEIQPIVNALDPAVDVVISGHTHQAYICHATAKDGQKDILLTSAGNYGRFLTDIELTVDARSGDITAASAHNLAVVNDLATPPTGYTALAKDPEQQQLIDTYNALATPLANAVIGSISADMTRTANSAGESALGDVIADAQLAATAAADKGASLVAFMNPGGIRADLLVNTTYGTEASGEIAYGEAFTVQPFYNTLVAMTLTGAQIKALLEQQFDNPAVGQNRFLQVSAGFTYTWDASQPTGSKVVAGSIQIGGTPVVAEQSYRVTVNSFLAGGGDNFTVLKQGTDPLGGDLDIDALVAYFGQQSPVAPGPQNRIQRVN